MMTFSLSLVPPRPSRMGMTDGYRQWLEAVHNSGHEETVQALAEHWKELTAEQEQAEAPIEAQRSGFDGERSRSGMSELSPQAEANDMELTAAMGGQTFG